MRIRLRLFAMLRDRAGWREREYELPAGASVADAWSRLAQEQPALAGYGDVVRFAVNGAYAAPGRSLADGDELAIIPPVAGGAENAPGEADPPLLRCELSPDPISDELLAELRRTLPTPADGALVIFVGQTRETPGTPAPTEEAEAARHAGKQVQALDYEAFEEMTLSVLHSIAEEIAARFKVRRLAMIHRVGEVPLSAPSVVVAAAAGHRGEAFDACRYAIDELKARAPIWKRERYADGTLWIGMPARPGPEEDAR